MNDTEILCIILFVRGTDYVLCTNNGHTALQADDLQRRYIDRRGLDGRPEVLCVYIEGIAGLCGTPGAQAGSGMAGSIFPGRNDLWSSMEMSLVGSKAAVLV